MLITRVGEIAAARRIALAVRARAERVHAMVDSALAAIGAPR